MNTYTKKTYLMIGCFAFIAMASCLPGIATANLMPGDNVTVNYLNVNSASGTQVISINGHTENVYTGPYTLQVTPQGGSPLLPSLWMCFDASVLVGAPWGATVQGTVGTAATYYLSSPVALTKAEMIGYLANLWQQGIAPLKNIQLAMWEVTADYNSVNSVLDVGVGSFYLPNADAKLIADVDLLLANALDAVKKGGTYDATYLIPNAGTVTQPFVQPVPEPGTLLLLGTGLIGAAGFSRRFIRRKK